MGEYEEKEIHVINTKLDLLIQDFKRFRECTEIELKEITKHNQHEDMVQMDIQSRVKWHSTIGSFVILSAISYGIYIHKMYSTLEDLYRENVSQNRYYKENRETIIEIIEKYKMKKKGEGSIDELVRK